MDLDFTADPGVTALFGPAGAGKTALLEAVAGLLKPDSGRILVDGEILFDAAAGVDRPVRSRPCVYLAAGSALFPHMTVRGNLLFAAKCRRLPRLERHRRVNELLERFRLEAAAEQRPGDVAPSDRESAVLARALVSRPKVLLIDGPWHGLDAWPRRRFHDLVHRARSEFGVTVLVAVPVFEECCLLADRLLVLAQGRVVQSGTPRQVAHEPASAEVARAIGGYTLFPAEITALDPGRNTCRLRLAGAELAGPYLPGRLLGDKVTVCVRPAELSAWPAGGKPGLNQVVGRLLRVTELPHAVLLRFNDDITVEMPAAAYEEQKHRREWLIEFPPGRWRVL